MQTNAQKLSSQKFLISSLFAVGFGVIITNLIGEGIAIQFGNWAYVPIVGALVVLSIIIATRNRLQGSQGKGWMLFLIMAVCWFIAEQVWLAYELFYEIDPYPSEADFFWLVGYPLYFGFLMLYVTPFKKAISKKFIITSSLFALALLVPSLYLSYDEELDFVDIENLVAIAYPLADAIVMIPALIGVALFFKGKVNFLWTLMCIGIFCDIIADSAFLFTTLDDSYYTGHPIDILYMWSYILFSFGVYDHIKVFKTQKKKQINT